MIIMKILQILYRGIVLSIFIYTLEYDFNVIGLDLDRETLEKMAKFLKGRVLFATHLSFVSKILQKNKNLFNFPNFISGFSNNISFFGTC
jgi:hypothetical protein